MEIETEYLTKTYGLSATEVEAFKILGELLGESYSGEKSGLAVQILCQSHSEISDEEATKAVEAALNVWVAVYTE